MVEKLLLPPATTQAPQMRITGLVLSSPSVTQLPSLDATLRAAGSVTCNQVLEQVAQNPDLWLGTIHPAFLDSRLASIELLSWRRANGNLFAWSGLTTIPGESLPQLIINPDPDNRTTKLQVRWKVEPDPFPRGSATYEARVIAGEDNDAPSKDDEATPEPEQEESRRADLLFVFVPPRGRIEFRFAEVKYRRHLAMARASALVDMVLTKYAIRMGYTAI